MEASKPVQTLSDLIEEITRQDRIDIARMLRTLAGHISMAANKDASQIAFKELVGIQPELRQYLREKEEAGEFTRNSVRSYMNYFRILMRKAQRFGAICSPEVEKQWAPMAAAVAHECGCPDIVRDAVRKGVLPNDYTGQHLNAWCEQMARNGRHPDYIANRVRAFRKRMLESGLANQLPCLDFRTRKQPYGISLEAFPEPLKTEAESVLRWKVVPHVRGRPIRYRCREVTVVGLKSLFRLLFGYANRFLHTTPQNLSQLLSEKIVGPYADWLLEKREVDPQTVVDRLRMIPHLALNPLLKGQDFKWVREIISELPPHDKNAVKERKQRKFVRFQIVIAIVDRLVNEANSTTDAKQKAILIRDALLILFLTALAWRQRNIRECRLAPSTAGGNIFKEPIPAMSTMALPGSAERAWESNPDATFWQFSFDSNGTKSKRPVRAVLPCQLVPLLEQYIEVRPALIGSGKADPGTLFLNDHGDPLLATSLAHHLRGITSRYVGKQINPHLFRDILAEAWLASGRGLEGLSTMLWHADPGFTRRVYGGMFDESHGTKGLEEWLENKKLGKAMTDAARKDATRTHPAISADKKGG